MSDGGGEAPLLEGVPLSAVVATCAVFVTIALAIFGHFRQLRAERNGAVDAALVSLLSPAVIEARVRVVQVARGELIYRYPSPLFGDAEDLRRSNDEVLDVVDQLRAASLTLMWAVQAIEPRLRPFVRKRTGLSRRAPWLDRSEELHAPSAAALHAQLVDIMEDLGRALDLSGIYFDWRRDALLTNAALDALPVIASEQFRFTSDGIRRLDIDRSGDEDSILREAFGQTVTRGSSKSFAQWKEAQEQEKAKRNREWAEHRAQWMPAVKPPRPVKGRR